tara:strand:+ start:3438 stop:3716 length:279 start_codon:yes stop_codon:yes gene_type:complete
VSLIGLEGNPMRSLTRTLGDAYDDATAVALGKAKFKKLSPGGKLVYIGVVLPLFYIMLPAIGFLTFIVYIAFKPFSLIAQFFTRSVARYRER